MNIKIIFDKRSSCYEKDNFEMNEMFVKAICQHIYDLYKSQGYVYKESIYKIFGFEWDPYDANECLIYEQNGKIKYKITKQNESNNICIDILSEK